MAKQDITLPRSVWAFSSQFPITDEACLLLMEIYTMVDVEKAEEKLTKTYRENTQAIWRDLCDEGWITENQLSALHAYSYLDWCVHYELHGSGLTGPGNTLTHKGTLGYALRSHVEIFVLFPGAADRLKFKLTYKEHLPWQMHRVNPQSYEI